MPANCRPGTYQACPNPSSMSYNFQYVYGLALSFHHDCCAPSGNQALSLAFSQAEKLISRGCICQRVPCVGMLADRVVYLLLYALYTLHTLTHACSSLRVCVKTILQVWALPAAVTQVVSSSPCLEGHCQSGCHKL